MEQKKKQTISALMNIRMPGGLSETLLSAQDDYLHKERDGKGIVKLAEIPTLREQFGGDAASGGVQIAVKTVTDFLREHGDAVDRVIFNVFKDSDREIYEEIFRSLSL